MVIGAYKMMNMIQYYGRRPRIGYRALRQMGHAIYGLKPRLLLLETTTKCNARCSYCGTKGKRHDMDLDLYKSIIDSATWAWGVLPNRRGEPLMYPHIVEAVRYARQAGKYAMISTNGSLLTEDIADQLLRTSIDLIRFSIDECEAERFEMSRVGLSFEAVENNLENLLSIRNRMGSKTRVVVRATVGDWNKDRICTIRDYWLNKGIDEFIAKPEMVVPTEREIEAGPFIKYNPIICREPYNCLTVSYDGTVPLCCNDWYDTYRLGKVNGEENTADLLRLYNSSKFRRYRNDLLIGNRVPMICYNCRERENID